MAYYNENEGSYTVEQIMSNRRKWIDFLKQPDIKKAEGWLDFGDGSRCCLGHGCFILGIRSVTVYPDSGSSIRDGIYLEYEGREAFPPRSFVEMVGLYSDEGDFVPWSPAIRNADGEEKLIGIVYNGHRFYSLSAWNDDSSVTPQEIGAYLESVIDGGENTPFLKLV